MDNKEYILVKRRDRVALSDVLNDCADLGCIKTYRNEPLSSILRKICSQISSGGLTFLNTGNVQFTVVGDTVSASYTGPGGDTNYTDEQAQDAVGLILSNEFYYNDNTPSISINQIDWNKIINKPAFGGVSSVSVANLNTLFTSNVATPTTTPSITFSFINAPANSFFGKMGPTGTPVYNTAAVLSRVNDENVNITLGGSPTTALLSPVSLNVSWVGQLSLAKGGTGASLVAPSTDAIMFYDVSAASTAYLSVGSGLNLSGTTLSANAFPAEQFPKRVAHFIVGGSEMATNANSYSSSSFAGLTVDQLMVFVDGDLLFNNRNDRLSFSFSDITLTFTTGLAALTSVQVFVVPPAQDGSPTNPVQPLIYFGAKSTGTSPNISEIVAGSTSNANGGATVTINWQPFNSTFQFLWFAIPDLGPAYNKTTWYGSPLNNGSIGGGSNLFGSPSTVTIGGQAYRVWITNYSTKFFENIQLS